MEWLGSCSKFNHIRKDLNMLIDEIKKASLQAMKERDSVKRGILSVVITKYNNLAIELKAKGQEANDVSCANIIQKTIKELEDERANFDELGRADKVAEIDKQYETIKVFLPKQLSECEIREIIASLEDKSMPSIMKHFKANYDGQVNMSLVSAIARDL